MDYRCIPVSDGIGIYYFRSNISCCFDRHDYYIIYKMKKIYSIGEITPCRMSGNFAKAFLRAIVAVDTVITTWNEVGLNTPNEYVEIRIEILEEFKDIFEKCLGFKLEEIQTGKGQ